jgi:hypothetical protein
MPGISPRCAALRRQIRQMPNLRYTARCRPHIVQRVYARTLNFGLRFCLTIQQVFAMAQLFLSAPLPPRPFTSSFAANGIPSSFRSQ